MIVVCADYGRYGDNGVATRTVLDHNRLAPTFTQSIAEEARAEIDATARSEGHDELDRPLWPSLRHRWDDRQQQ
jgi:hypothetical protein